MHRPMHTLALGLIAWLCVTSDACGQTLERIHIQYPQQMPEVLLSGSSPVYWEDIHATTTVAGSDVSIVIDPPGLGFSVVSPWTIAVPLPVPQTGIYDITVSLRFAKGVAEQIGFLKGLIIASPRLFHSSFED